MEHSPLIRAVGRSPVLIALLFVAVAATRVSAGDTEPRSELSGPSSVVGQLDSDEAARESAPAFSALARAIDAYFGFKERLLSERGLRLGIDYSALVFGATASLGEDSAASGIFRVFGQWDLLNRGEPDQGSFVFKFENRHRLGTDVTPQDFGFEVGYQGLPGTAFSDRDWILTNLFWMQKLVSGRLGVVVGLIDTTDYVNLYGLLSPWTDFTNLVFSTGDTIPIPNQGLGAGLSLRIADHFYALVSIADANGDPADPGHAFQSFFETAEYFSFVEFGWLPAFQDWFTDNAHLTLWHADAREDAGTSRGWGVSLSWSRRYKSGWEPFVRVGFAENGGALSEYSASAGVGYGFANQRAFLGVGANWNRPSEDTFGPGLDDQYTVEVYCRFQGDRVLAITPSVQLLINPAQNPAEDVIVLFGIRIRLSF